MENPHPPVLQDMYYPEEENDSNSSFEEIFSDETKALEEFESDLVFTETDANLSDLSFEEHFADELRLLETKQQPNFYITTMDLRFEEILEEELVVLGQTIINKEPKAFKMHNTIDTYLQLL